MDIDYKKRIINYFKKNLSRGYTEESLKWALVNQGYSRTDISRAIEQVHKELAEKAPEIKEKPKIKYQIYDKDNNPIKVEVRRPFSIKNFFRNLFSS